MSTTNARVRAHFEGEGSPYVATDEPNNGADTVVDGEVRTHVVTGDGTNIVDLSAAARLGHEVTVVHNGGANTPKLSFDDANFVGTGPGDLTSAGATATVKNVDGSPSGWVVTGTGGA
ncbi:MULTISPECIES: hypothetical protein [Halobacterium]|uniref:hypothetical protein n=1 Tax=Halobacterium TaxID=2239 RepID=UPI001966694B|nr:hypothetical protein [Halobacterium sp. BOL4-2]QRY26365.1 hypothetical protein JRZ79_13020 [Halobacterium sp. BOL4-2]